MWRGSRNETHQLMYCEMVVHAEVWWVSRSSTHPTALAWVPLAPPVPSVAEWKTDNPQSFGP